MKRLSIAIVMIVTILLSGCAHTDSPSMASTPQIPDRAEISPQASGSTASPEATDNDEKEIIQNCLNQYYVFLSGEISVSHYQNKNSMYDINDIFRADENHNRFTFCDSNDNGIPELHLSSMRSYYIIECMNDTLVMLYSGSGYETLLNNGAVLYTRESLIKSRYTSCRLIFRPTALKMLGIPPSIPVLFALPGKKSSRQSAHQN